MLDAKTINRTSDGELFNQQGDRYGANRKYEYTIESAFKECFYIVPDYQREYVWTEKQVSKLLEDIDE